MKEPHHKLWRVFFPSSCLRSPSGICLGWISQQRQLICIVGIAHASNRELSDQVSHLKDSDDVTLQMVGVWVNDRLGVESFKKDDTRSTPTMQESYSSRKNIELLLHQHQNEEVPINTLRIKQGRTKLDQTTLFIIYDEKQLLASNWGPDQVPFHSEICKKGTVPKERTDIEELLHIVQTSVTDLRQLKSEDKIRMSCEMLSDDGWHWMKFVMNPLWNLFGVQLRIIFGVLDFLLDNR